MDRLGLPHIAACSLVVAAIAAQSERRIGVFFWHDSPNDTATFAGVRDGLRQAGLRCSYVRRQANSNIKRARAGLRQLHDERCELVLALGTRATQLAQQELPNVPVVFAAVTNPVAAGIVTDWGPSGQQLCGASNWIDPRSVLDVFRLAAPELRRLGILRSQTSGVVSQAELTSMRAHLAETPSAPIELIESVATDVDDLGRATQALLDQSVDAIWVPIDITVYRHIDAIERALANQRVPLLTTAAAGVRNGALVGAAVDYDLHGRRAAAVVLDVLRHGRDPASLPIDRMHSSLVVVNLTAARRTGIELPLSVLALADELIAAEANDGKRR